MCDGTCTRDSKTPEKNDFSFLNQGVVLTLPVIGRISTGDLVPAKNGKQRPFQTDSFSITTLVNDHEKGWEKDPLESELLKGAEKLTRIPVRIAFNNIRLNLFNRFSAFEQGRMICSGDGKNATRLVENGHETVCCPGPESCAFGQKMYCKDLTRVYFRIDGQSSELGLYILRSASYHSLRYLASKILYLTTLTGGNVAGMPMDLVLRGRTSRASCGRPFWIYDLDLPKNKSLKDVFEESQKYQKEMTDAGFSIAAAENALLAGIEHGIFSEDDEDWSDFLADDETQAAEAEKRMNKPRGIDEQRDPALDALLRNSGNDMN